MKNPSPPITRVRSQSVDVNNLGTSNILSHVGLSMGSLPRAPLFNIGGKGFQNSSPLNIKEGGGVFANLFKIVVSVSERSQDY